MQSECCIVPRGTASCRPRHPQQVCSESCCPCSTRTCCSFVSFAKRAQVGAEQRAALMAVFDATNGTAWLHANNWGIGDPCDSVAPWYGVSCDAAVDLLIPPPPSTPYGVTALSLPANHLVGTLPDDAVAPLLSTLQLLDLSHNELTGSLPPSLATAPLLHTTALSPRYAHTAVSGPPLVPPATRFLYMERTKLQGTLPDLSGLNCTERNAAPDAPACLIWFVQTPGVHGNLSDAICNKSFAEIYLANSSVCGGVCASSVCAYASEGPCDPASCHSCP